MIYEDGPLGLFFGDKSAAIERSFFDSNKSQIELNKYIPLEHIKKKLFFKEYIFLKQMHTAIGYTITESTKEFFLHNQLEGDFLTTSITDIGLALYSADCLPIIFYDPVKGAIGICHAGWRGSVDKVALRALEQLEKEYGTTKEHVQVFFGPCARACCYRVEPSFKQYLQGYDCLDTVFFERNKKLFFDLVAFTILQLTQYGVKLNAINTNYAYCTMHTISFCSYRRDTQTAKRQVTIVALKNMLHAD
jgi:polyphenol oxidase